MIQSHTGHNVSLSSTVSIVIVSWNTCTHLQRCLDHVSQELQRSEPHSIEVFVIDNASHDGSPHLVSRSYPFVNLTVNDKNLGFAAANNQGIKSSKGRYILLLNSDTELHAGALSTMVDFMEKNPRAGAVGARLLNHDGSLQPACHPMLTPEREFWRLSFLDQVWRRSTYVMESWDSETPRRVEAIKGACLLLRREALEQVGLLDERYHMYTEEVDLCYRLAKAEWELWYVPQAVVTHYGGASSEQAADDMYVQLYRSKVQFYRKFGGSWRARRYKFLTYLVYLPRATLQPQNKVYRRLLAELPEM